MRIIGTKVNKTKVRTVVNTMERINMSEMGITITKTTSSRINMVTRTIRLGHMFLLKSIIYYMEG